MDYLDPDTEKARLRKRKCNVIKKIEKSKENQILSYLPLSSEPLFQISRDLKIESFTTGILAFADTCAANRKEQSTQLSGICFSIEDTCSTAGSSQRDFISILETIEISCYTAASVFEPLMTNFTSRCYHYFTQEYIIARV